MNSEDSKDLEGSALASEQNPEVQLAKVEALANQEGPLRSDIPLVIAERQLGLNPAELGYSINFPPSVAREVVPDEAYWQRVQENALGVQAIDENLVQQVAEVIAEGNARSQDLMANYDNSMKTRERETKRQESLKKAREMKAQKDANVRADRKLSDFNVKVTKGGDVKPLLHEDKGDGEEKGTKNSSRKQAT